MNQIIFLLLSVALSEHYPDSAILKLDSTNFDRSLQDFPYLLVQFYAKWCAHCRKLEPRIEAVDQMLAQKHPHIKIAEVDIDESPELAEKFNITEYPKLKFFKKGEMIDYTGTRGEENMLGWLVKHSEEYVKIIKSTEELEEFRKAHPVCFVMLGSRKSSAYQRYLQAVLVSEGNYFAIIEDKGVFFYEPKSEYCMVFFKHNEEKFGIIVNFDNLEEFIRSKSTPWVLSLDETAINEVFIKKRPGMFLFTRENNGKELMYEVADYMTGRLQAVYGNIASVLHSQFAEILGISGFEMPFAMIINENLQKFVWNGPIDKDNLINFYNNYSAGKLEVYYMSQKQVLVENSITKLIGKGFFEEVSKEDTLVMFWIPNCGYCRMVNAEYEIVAETAEGVRIASLDYSKNEAEGLEVKEFPSFIYYSKGSSKGLVYTGPWTASDILEFLKLQSVRFQIKVDL